MERELSERQGEWHRKQFEYPVFIDVEATPASAKAGATEAAIAFCRELEAAGYYAGIYSSTYSGFRDRLEDSKLTPFTHWVAQYASKCTYGGAYGIWQYSSSGRVDGISGNVDMDISYQNYSSIIKAGGFNGYAKQGSVQETTPVQPHKTIDELAREVLAGKWGNGEDRKSRITTAGYDYAAVQAKMIRGGNPEAQSCSDPECESDPGGMEDQSEVRNTATG